LFGIVQKILKICDFWRFYGYSACNTALICIDDSAPAITSFILPWDRQRNCTEWAL